MMGRPRIQKRHAALGVVAATSFGLAVLVAKGFGVLPGRKTEAKEPAVPRHTVADTLRLQRAWQAKGSPPCEHPENVTEYYRDKPTGYVVCTTCGESFRESAAVSIL